MGRYKRTDLTNPLPAYTGAQNTDAGNRGDIILAPVSIDDVNVLLTGGSTDLGTLCKKENINPWSRRKPIRNSSLSPLTENDFYNSSYGIHLSSDSGFNAIFPDLTKDSSHLEYLFTDHKTTTYLAPRGNSTINGTTYFEPYRLTDFNGYNKNAHPLLYTSERTALYKTGVVVDNWLFSVVRDLQNRQILNYSEGNELELNAFLDTTYHLTPGTDKLYKIKYKVTNNGTEVVRYRFQEVFNEISISMLSNGDSSTNYLNSEPTIYSDLTLSDLHLFDSSIFTNRNYSFGIILRFKGRFNYRYFLYNTRFNLANLYNQSGTPDKSTIKFFKDEPESVQDYNSVDNEYTLAQRSGSNLVIKVYPWLISSSLSYVTRTVEGTFCSYYTVGGNNYLDTTGMQGGDIIDMKLCLCQNESGEGADRYIKEITSSNVSSLVLKSCEFTYGSNMKSVPYAKVSCGKISGTNDYYEFENIDTNVNLGGVNNGQAVYNTNLTATKSLAREGANSGENVYKYDIINLLKYVSRFYKYVKWLYYTVERSNDTDDPFYAYGSYYQATQMTYTDGSGDSNRTAAYNECGAKDKEIAVSIKYSINAGSVETVSGINEGFYNDSTQVTSGTETNNDHLYVTFDNNSIVTVTQYTKLSLQNYGGYGSTVYTNTNNPTGICYNSNTIASTDKLYAKVKYGSAREINHWYILRKESNWSGATVDITITFSDIRSSDGRSFSYSINNVPFSTVFSGGVNNA